MNSKFSLSEQEVNLFFKTNTIISAREVLTRDDLVKVFKDAFY